jgi:hypothetical protein
MPVNPYLADASSAITNQVTQNLQRNILPGINSGAIAAGGFGGSRQGVAQGLAIGQTNQGLSNSLANLSYNAWDSDANRQQQSAMQQAQLASGERIAGMQDATNRYGLGNSYNLGLGQLGLGAGQLDLSNRVADQNFYTNQRGQDISQMGLGANLANTGNLGLSNQGSQLWGLGGLQQQAPWQALGNYSGAISPFTGLNGSSTTNTPGPSGLSSGLGGMITLAQLYKLLSGG